ncbi:hypothetical protein ACT691_05515 [Vibrio metschnikovii]
MSPAEFELAPQSLGICRRLAYQQGIHAHYADANTALHDPADIVFVTCQVIILPCILFR